MSVKFTKSDIRKSNLEELKKRVEFCAKSSHYSILNRLEKLINLQKAKNILIFMPLGYEVDIYKLRRIMSKKCNFFVPFMVELSLKMVKCRLPFAISKFRVKEPKSRKFLKTKIDMAIVPVIGVDKNMARIGHGKGFYDRFFSSLSYDVKDIVFVQILDKFCMEKLSESFDIVCDFYLTPRKNYMKRGRYDRNFSRIRSRCGGCWCRVSSS